MREIKFRAWDKYLGRMIGPVELIRYDATKLLWQVLCLAGKEDSYAPMQYTGLRDKSGKEIYEGDIVRMFDRPPSDDAWDLRVEWESGKFILTSLRDMGEYWGDLGDWFDCEWRVAMVGNIYENPELLKEKA